MPVHPLKLSPAQAIILLSETDTHGELKAKHLPSLSSLEDNDIIKYLHRLYLCGVESTVDTAIYNEIKAYYAKHGITVSGSLKQIDTDPTRRYFETILAYYTVHHHIAHLDMNDIDKVLRALLALYPHKPSFATFREYIKKKDHEMAVALSDTEKLSASLSEQHKECLHKIFCIACLPTHLTSDAKQLGGGVRLLPHLPLGIYSESFFHPDHRGRISRLDLGHDPVRPSMQKGTATAKMPVLRDESSSDVVEFAYWRGPESTVPDYEHINNTAGWLNYAYSYKTHPFVNSISGTLLVSLRWLKYQGPQSPFWPIDKLKPFLRTFIAALLYVVGGHSLFEFATVLKLPKIIAGFKNLPGFSQCNLYTLFLDENRDAFEIAFKKTLQYTKQYVGQKGVFSDLATAANKQGIFQTNGTILPRKLEAGQCVPVKPKLSQ